MPMLCSAMIGELRVTHYSHLVLLHGITIINDFSFLNLNFSFEFQVKGYMLPYGASFFQW
eukprot:snap_masked-scaffold_11-processed-gene-10.41-mRNA-1 protein AED:1.00 eAED:1.00 QI:0/0/0/0/1/1/2/0/59